MDYFTWTLVNITAAMGADRAGVEVATFAMIVPLGKGEMETSISPSASSGNE